MEKKILKRHKRNKAELAVIDRTLDRLYEQLEDVEEVSGKVTKSSDDFPYIEEHMTVRMADPKKADPIKARIRVREARKAKIEAEMLAVEEFIGGLPEGMDKRIFEMVFLDGASQQEVGEEMGYSKGRISQIISKYCKD
ncbi:MAG: sigma-70 family RNA polymerase sigma factor [Dorea sp.]|nr:sigma-70 family RNA polymerase sigma factor [Dorea sp.]